MTRTTAGTIPAHHFDQARRKPAKTTFRHTLLTRSLTRTFKDAFGSVQSVEMSVLTMVPKNFNVKIFVHFSSPFTGSFCRESKRAQSLTRARRSVYSLNLDSITAKIAIL